MGEQWRGLDDKTKKEYEQKAKEHNARMETEGRLVPRRRKKLGDSSITVDNITVTSTGNFLLN